MLTWPDRWTRTWESCTSSLACRSLEIERSTRFTCVRHSTSTRSSLGSICKAASQPSPPSERKQSSSHERPMRKTPTSLYTSRSSVRSCTPCLELDRTWSMRSACSDASPAIPRSSTGWPHLVSSCTSTTLARSASSSRTVRPNWMGSVMPTWQRAIHLDVELLVVTASGFGVDHQLAVQEAAFGLARKG